MATSQAPTPNSTKRLLLELRTYTNNPLPTHLDSLHPTTDEDLYTWSALLIPPPQTPYTPHLLPLTLTIPPTYPLAPPTVKFAAPLVHPNVSFPDGEICLTLLTTEHWSPAYTLSTTLEAIAQLLAEPNLDSPLNLDVANLLRNGDGMAAEALVRFWCAEAGLEVREEQQGGKDEEEGES